MIEEFVQAWEANKEKLEEYISTTNQYNYGTYNEIVKMLFNKVINPHLLNHGSPTYDTSRLHEIDDGDYQGTLLYIIPQDSYQPSAYEYVVTCVDYGSCTVCDTLQRIQEGNYDIPTKEQVKEYMTLCLNILQRCKRPYNWND